MKRLFLLTMFIWQAAYSAYITKPELFGAPLVIVDAGHGGKDRGNVSEGTEEKDLTLRYALLLRDTLQRRGIRVVMTRTEDISLPLKARREIADKYAKEAMLFVSIHIEKTQNSNPIGIESYFHLKRFPPKAATTALWYIESIQRRIKPLLETYDLPTRQGAKDASFYLLRTPPMPAIHLEIGNLANAKERVLLQDPAYYEALIEKIAEGIAARIDSLIRQSF